MKERIKTLLANRTILLLLLLMLAVLLISQFVPGFVSVENLLGVTQFGAMLLLLAFGQTIVVIAGGGGVDLSVGAVMSLSGVLFGMLCTKAGMGIWLAAGITIALGLLMGLVNGLVTSYLHISPLIATLSTSYIYSSLALYLTNGVPLSGFAERFAWIGQDATLMIPNQVLFVALPISLLMLYLVNHTKYGRYLYAIGANATAANFAGVPIRKIRCTNYMISGALSGLASIVMCSWLMTARADAGSGYDLSSLAVTVLGGISINGGSGKLSGVIVSVLIITIISTGIQYANLNGIWQQAVLGLILLVSVTINQLLIMNSQKTSRALKKQMVAIQK